ncbi:MAG TPA: flotillin family protein [Verrucomicrobia bacterium]|nr:flotillin family protein [Verrucomicrobiota bacterium]HOP98522.1 flotillin family protein [Verrucomicrobiota bacterium]
MFWLKLLIAFVVVVAMFLGVASLFCIRKIQPGRAGVKTGWGGIKVSFDWMIRIPLVQTYHIVDISVKKLEISRKGKDGLVCKDNIRADISVAFYIRVEATEESVRKVAQMLTPERVSDMVQLRELFEAKFSEALKTAGKQMEFHELFTERIKFRDQIQATIGKDLDGFLLQDVAIDYLEQTPLDQHDPDNVLDAEGIKKITQITQRERVVANEHAQRASVQIEKENADADIARREQKRRNEEDNARQTRAITEVRANEEAEARKVIEARRLEVEAKRLEVDEAIRLRTEDMNRAVQEREYTVKKERQRLEQEALQEGEEARVRRERTVALAELDKDAKVAEAGVEVERKRAIVVAEQKAVVQQEEEKLNIEARMTAERVREVTLIEADMNAKKEQVEKVVAAEAQKEAEQHMAEAEKIKVITAAEAAREAALREAERIQTIAEAEAKASERKRHAMEQEAEGVAAQEAAKGIAEAKVITAKAGAKKVDAAAIRELGLAEADVIKAKGDVTAEVTQMQAEAEAEGTKDKELATAAGIQARGLAEAKAIEEKAKAMKLLHEAGQAHEEFRLRLAKERDVELAAINVERYIAEAHSNIVGEALKNAKIDIVGGENDFFEKVVRAVGRGKAVDRLVQSSATLTDLKTSLFNGDAEHFRAKLRQWVKDFGVTSEDLKNLTVAALLAKLIASTKDSGLQSVLRSAQAMAKESGLGDVLASSVISEPELAKL